MQKLPKELPIVTFNLSGWNNKKWKEKTGLNWGDRLERLCNYIKTTVKEPFIIALQAVQLGGGRYLATLKQAFPNFHVILPMLHAAECNPRSAINIMLINNCYCSDYDVMGLEGLEGGGKLLYNYVQIALEGNLSFQIFNVHIPYRPTDGQAGWYIGNRKLLADDFELIVKKKINSEPDNLIILGDFNETPQSNYMQSLGSFVDPIPSPDPTYRGQKADYILYSKGMSATGFSFKAENTYQQPVAYGWTDHAMLVGGLILNCGADPKIYS